MPQSNSTMIHKLQRAINEKFHQKLCINRQQWYSKDQDRPVTTYVIRQAIWSEEKQKNCHIELFKSTSEIQLVLWLRDKWYELNGWEIPTDNKKWNEIKKKNANVSSIGVPPDQPSDSP